MAGARSAAVHDDRLATSPHRRAGAGHPGEQPLRRRVAEAGDGPLAGTAADAVAFVERSYAAWKAGVDALDEAGLARAVGPAEGPYAERSMATLILHINREVMHHGAEVALLRDLYREKRRGR